MDKKEFINSKLEKDFYDQLPENVCMILDNLIMNHADKEWFVKSFNKYRNHILESYPGEMRMPGFIFNEYLNEDEQLQHSLIIDSFTKDECLEGMGKIIDYLEHDGVAHDENPPGRGSGRYPYGSGKNPYQHEHPGDFNAWYLSLIRQGFTETEIARDLGISSTKLRALRSFDGNNERKEKIAFVKKELAENPNQSKREIGVKLGKKFNKDGSPVNESTVRSLLNDISEYRTNVVMDTAEKIKKAVDASPKGMVDVGTKVEKELGVTRTRFDTALSVLEEEGYIIRNIPVPQATNKGQYTTMKIIQRPDVKYDGKTLFEDVSTLVDYMTDEKGERAPRYLYPESMDSKRLLVKFRDNGGLEKDGLVQIRRGVPDLSLGESNYAQVRILVDNDYYIKGMAVYGRDEDFPKGVDVIFNTNKDSSEGKLGALKSIKKNLAKDPNNPFGSAIIPGINEPDNDIGGGQSYYIGKDGKKHLSLINKRADEGEWGGWSKELPSQMLGKQPKSTIERQLSLAKLQKDEEYKEILEVTNPTIKRAMLKDFAEKADKAAEELKAAPFPGQKYQVILPLETIRDNECYAPNYENGQKLALIRYPHAGTFEIPVVTVNNKNKEGIEVITPSAKDAMGINAKTAGILSGADFDGDTVMVIPLQPDKFAITTQDPLPGLLGFDPTVEYGPDPKLSYEDKNGVRHCFRNGVEYPLMDEGAKQTQMGVISNLITDMTLKGASDDEIARAVRHSMVVIDAVKHELDYKSSEKENGIEELHRKWQGRIDPETGKYRKGAATILSRASGEIDIPARKEGQFIAKDTGHILTEIDPEKKLYLDEQTGQIYRQWEKKTVNVDPETGKKLYRNTNEIYYKVSYKDPETGKPTTARVYNKDGKQFYKDKKTGEYVEVKDLPVKEIVATQKVTQMAYVDDATKLISEHPSPKEYVYADYANHMKELANEARKEAEITHDIPYSRSARDVYKDEVEDLYNQLDNAERNTPRERHAQTIAAAEFKAYYREHPNMTAEEQSKKKQRLLTEARIRVNAARKEINISDKQWEAIQAGAIPPSRLADILKFASDRIKQLATPYKERTILNKTQINRAKSMLSKGYTNQEVAELFGISTSTLQNYLSGKE